MTDRILITGGTGFLGARVTAHLADAGFEVVTAATSPPPPGLPGEHLRVDLCDLDAACQAAAGARYIVHLAASSGGIGFQQSHDPALFDTNRVLTNSILRAADDQGAERVFLASSGVVYRDKPHGHLAETDDLLAPADHPTPYAWSKISDEVVGGWWQASSPPEIVIGRLGNIFGPGAPLDPARSTVVHALVARALATRPGGALDVWGTGNAVRSFIFVDDAARAVAQILQHGEAGGIYNIDTGQPTTIAELAQTICRQVDVSLRPAFDASKPEGPAMRVLDSSKLQALGWEPCTHLDKGLARVVEALRTSSRNR